MSWSHQGLPPILVYHKVERRWELGVTRISPKRFARHIERLARDGYRSLTLDELSACTRGRPATDREIVLTFDDGYRGLRDHAFPVLVANGFTAICFIITDYAGRLNRWDVAYGGRRFAHLSWREIRSWSDRGIEFASHTATHPRLPWLDDTSVARELTVSKRAIERALGSKTVAISFPFGVAGERERRLAREAGYDLGVVIGGKWSGEPLALPRVPVYAWASPTPWRGVLAPLERAAGTLANRCAVGTSIWQRVTRSISPRPA